MRLTPDTLHQTRELLSRTLVVTSDEIKSYQRPIFHVVLGTFSKAHFSSAIYRYCYTDEPLHLRLTDEPVIANSMIRDVSL